MPPTAKRKLPKNEAVIIELTIITAQLQKSERDQERSQIYKITLSNSAAQTEAAEFSVQPNAPNSAAQTPKERSRD